ncbi:extracellular solute-binding protein [Galbitalea sp. SE-J8]|uniref:ABC transporter substrate-binding protein n=1 Tax=Galbitalea sp. SE-J8 TaxID=3054952 RepID=UPI00259D11BE|nr:extracellular solute-binding protein [Galbitalea sp. SE-J8]MDM4762057.1 extracellular solute-binding protein [Galbitalea sp. SE-J8]
MPQRRGPAGTSARTIPAIAVTAIAIGSVLGLAGCAPGSSGGAPTTSVPVSTDVGADKVELTLYDGQGLQGVDDALIAGFEKDFPNITITGSYDPDNVHAQNLPRTLSSDNAPDLAQSTSIVDEVTDGLFLDLDGYEKAYGWDDLGTQLAAARVSDDLKQGSGSLYGVPYGFVFSGVYYNKKLADQIGLTTLPATIDEFEAALAKAKAAGITPIIAAGQLGLGTAAFQNLLDAYAGAEPVSDWVYRADDASIDTPAALTAAEKLKAWIDAGYFNADVNSTTQDASYSRFADGEALFMMQGSWANPILAKAAAPDSYGFIAPPTDGADGVKTAVYNSATIGISARSAHPNEAAAFLNWLRSDAAREIVLANGNIPLSTGSSVPTESGSVTESLVSVFDAVSADGGLVPFVQNATSGINNSAWVPQTQSLFGDQITPKQFLANIQKAYEDELGR